MSQTSTPSSALQSLTNLVRKSKDPFKTQHGTSLGNTPHLIINLSDWGYMVQYTQDEIQSYYQVFYPYPSVVQIRHHCETAAEVVDFIKRHRKEGRQ